MRDAPGNANVSLRWNTPHPSRRCAPIHLFPQGEKGKSVNFNQLLIFFGRASGQGESPLIL
ncbi:MAG: hypothetical protein E5V75_29985 [Mesorhizobium sp.]|nr:MAG: hypothetical protein E5V75_29985 [Mesorhizobium sp.]